MSGFSRDWLTLREAADHRSRHDYSDAIAEHAPRSWRIVDLGCGTGSNLRYLQSRLGVLLPVQAAQTWTCVDNDENLLSALSDAAANPLLSDLDTDIAALLEVALQAVGTGEAKLVTASALLDLVSARWIDALVGACRSLQAAAWMALTYDGRITLEPGDPDDATLTSLVNAHQGTDKGFGPALGPAAHDYASRAFGLAGFAVQEVASDWQLAAADAPLLQPLIGGWLEAAREQTGDSALLRRWQALRSSQLAEGQLRVRVGHRDLLALPR